MQMLLGRKGKARPKTHTFPFTGLIRCGECSCLITAETKHKLIKSTGEIRSYTYYHCTRRKKDIVCSQRKNIRREDLERQIEQELEKYTILPEFRDWALEILRQSHEKEVEDRSKIYEMRHKTKSPKSNLDSEKPKTGLNNGSNSPNKHSISPPTPGKPSSQATYRPKKRYS